MRSAMNRFWCSLNYRYCMSSAYLAYNQGEMIDYANWMSRASEWQREYMMVGRRLV